jgi:ParB-like chromosome segregation protein Spo0J
VSEVSPRVRVPIGAAVLPGLTPEELGALRESLREHGQLVPILLDHRGRLVDGRHRLALCRELGLKPRVVRLDATMDESEGLALVVNVARRHLTAGARRALAEFELMRDPSRSDRSIAVMVGVSHGTVAAVRRELEERRLVAHAERRIGRNGVAQSAAPRRRRGRPQTADVERPSRVADEAGAAPATSRDRMVTARVPSWLAEAGDWVECRVRLVRSEAGYELETRDADDRRGSIRSAASSASRG